MASRVQHQRAGSAIDKSADERPVGRSHWNRPRQGLVRSVKEEKQGGGRF